MRSTVALVLGGLLALGGATVGTAAQKPSPEPAALEEVLEPIRAKHDLPALGGAIVTGERLTAIGAVGVRRLGSDAKVTRGDLWHLGSCTKAMTATLVARLVEKKKLSFDLTLAAAFPDLGRKIHEDYRPVTISLLLAHRGGTPADLRRGGLWARLWKREGTPTEQRTALVRGVLSSPPAVEPGTKHLYSNAGYAIAGAALERKTGRAFEALLREEVFEPLGMKGAGFGAPGRAGATDQPLGHRWSDGKAVPVPPGPGADNPPAIAPAGTVHASLADWARFVSVHLRGARGEDTGFLDPATIRRLHTPAEGQGYAFGWGVGKRPWAGGRVLSHAGSNTRWYCVTWVAPERNFAVLVTANRGDAAKAVDEAAGALIRFHRGR
jgi:CubicO group peptidase (beta-lactamase class C family)